MITELTRQLRSDEGEVLHAYQDHLGYWTLGVGRLIDDRKGGGISKAESAFLLANDIDDRRIQLDNRLPWWRYLDDARKGALLNMSFQLGIDGLLSFTTTLRLIKEGKYDQSSLAMLQSLWAKQTPERAHRMAMQIKTGEWQ